MSSPVTPFTEYDISDLPAPRSVWITHGFGSQQLVTGIGLIIGGFLRNYNATIAGAIQIYDGVDTTGVLLAPLGVPASATVPLSPAPPGILFRTGLYVHQVLGAWDLSVTYIPLLNQP